MHQPRRFVYRRCAVVMLYVLAAFWGATQSVVVENSLLDFANSLAFASSATLWFVVDRRTQAKSSLPVLQLLFFFTWPLASLIHLVRSRGLRGIGYWLAHVIGLLVTMVMTSLPVMFVL